MVKYGLIEDKELWEDYCQKWMAVQSLFWSMQRALIYHSCDVAVRLWLRTSWIMASAFYLNFGHIDKHAIEATAGYGKVMHGEVVAIGMAQVSASLKARPYASWDYRRHYPHVSEDWLAGGLPAME